MLSAPQKGNNWSPCKQVRTCDETSLVILLHTMTSPSNAQRRVQPRKLSSADIEMLWSSTDAPAQTFVFQRIVSDLRVYETGIRIGSG